MRRALALGSLLTACAACAAIACCVAAGLPSAAALQTSRQLMGVSDSERSRADSFAGQCRDRVRYSFFTTSRKFVRQEPNFCGAPVNMSATFDNMDACDWPVYVESVVLLPGISFVVAAVLLATWLVFWALRPCTCGGCRASDGCLCPDKHNWDVEVDGYTRRQVKALVIVSVAVAVLAVPWVVLGIMGNSDCTGSVSDVSDLVMGTASNILDVLHSVQTQLIKLEEDGLSSYVDSALKSLNSTIGDGDKFYDRASNINDYLSMGNRAREAVVYVSFLVPMFLIVLLAIGGCTKIQYLAWPLALSGLVFASLNFVLFGLHYPLGSGMADACTYVDRAIANNDTNGNVAYNYLFSCSNGSAIESLRLRLEEGISSAYSNICDVYQSGCTASSVPCDWDGDGLIHLNETCKLMTCPGDPSDCSAETFQSTWRDVTVQNVKLGCATGTWRADQVIGVIAAGDCPWTDAGGQTCNSTSASHVNYTAPCNASHAEYLTIQQCSTQCWHPTLRSETALIYKYMVELDVFTNILEYQVKPLLNCQRMRSLFDESRDLMCVRALYSTLPQTYSEACMGCVTLAATVAAVLGTKRFNKRNMRDYAPKMPVHELDYVQSDVSETEPSQPRGSGTPSSSLPKPLCPHADTPVVSLYIPPDPSAAAAAAPAPAVVSYAPLPMPQPQGYQRGSVNIGQGPTSDTLNLVGVPDSNSRPTSNASTAPLLGASDLSPSGVTSQQPLGATPSPPPQMYQYQPPEDEQAPAYEPPPAAPVEAGLPPAYEPPADSAPELRIPAELMQTRTLRGFSDSEGAADPWALPAERPATLEPLQQQQQQPVGAQAPQESGQAGTSDYAFTGFEPLV
eukprot:m51a1_g939 hypothetical protein (851) ;mRNA; f:251474-254928